MPRVIKIKIIVRLALKSIFGMTCSLFKIYAAPKITRAIPAERKLIRTNFFFNTDKEALVLKKY